MKPHLTKNLSHVGMVIMGGLLLNYYAFYNNFPFIYPDTGTYLISGIRGFVPEDRPLPYGLFLRHISLAETLWLPILVQGFMVSYLLYSYFVHFVKHTQAGLFFLLFVGFVTLFSGASVHVGMLLPDIFTAISFLALGLLLFVPKHKKIHLLAISVLLVFGVSCHNSNFYSVFVLLASFSLAYAIKRLRGHMAFTGAKRLGYIWLLVMGSILGTASLHYAYGERFSPSRGGHTFLLSRMHDMNLLKPFLNKNCGSKGYELCAYKDSLPDNFLWDVNSPIGKMGGGNATRADFNRILNDMFADGYTRNKFLLKTLEATPQLFASFDLGDNIGQHNASSPVMWPILETYSHQYGSLLNSRQNKGTLNFDLTNQLQRIWVLASLLLLGILLCAPINSRYRFFIAFILLALLINAGVSTMSGVIDRLQGRVVWLLALPVFLYFGNHPYVHKRLPRLARLFYTGEEKPAQK